MIKENEHKVDIVLLQLPFWSINCPPLGPALLKAYLQEHGYRCKVFDVNIHAYNIGGKDYAHYWDMANGYNYCMDREAMMKYYKNNRALFLEYMQRIKELNPKVVGCSCQCSSRILSEIFLEDLRALVPGIKHILGGPDVASFMKNTDSLLARDYIDAVNQDEGEISFVNYMRGVEKDHGLPIPGVVYKKDDRIIKGPPAIYIKKLDDLPFPDLSDYDFKRYTSPGSFPTYTTRGCVNKCNYCSAIGFMKTFRVRTAERVFAEIKHQKTLYPDLNYARMCDNISNAKIGELEKFCDMMVESKLGVKWNLENAVIRKEMRLPLYKKLKKSGCTLLGYGMETPSMRLLMDIGKNLCKDVDIAAVLREGKQAGLYVSVNIMFGLPGETEEDFQYLINFLRKNKKSFSMVNPSLNFCEYYPGSAGHADPDKHGLDLTKGHLFWESKDGTSTYLTRMKRFEEFCKLAKKYKLDNLFDVDELPNKHKLLFEYYFVSNEHDNALKEYELINEDDITEEIRDKVHAIKTGDFSILEEKEKRELPPLKDYLFYGDSFEETFLMTSLQDNLQSMEESDAFDGTMLKPWQAKLRALFLKIIGYHRIEKKINASYTTQRIIDSKLRSLMEVKRQERNGQLNGNGNGNGSAEKSNDLASTRQTVRSS